MKLSAPLKRDIATAEGLALYAASVFVAVLPAFPHTISWTHSAVYVGVLQIANIVSRRGLKAVASLNTQLGIDSGPTLPAGIPDVDTVLSDISAFEQAIADVQAQPGTPAPTVGLSPEPPAAQAPVA